MKITKDLLDDIAFNLYGVIFSYLEKAEQRELLDNLRSK